MKLRAARALTAGLLAVPACTVAGATVEAGYASLHVGGDVALAARTGGGQPAHQDVGSAFGLGDDRGSPYVRGQVGLGPAVLTGSAFGFSERGQGVLDASFGGLLAATPVTTELELGNAKLTAAIDVELGPVTLSPGLALDVFDFRFRATEPAFGNSEEIDEVMPVPLLFLRGAADAGVATALVELGWLRTPELDGSQLTLLDVEALLEWEPAEGVVLFAGYRAILVDAKGETDADRFEVDLAVDGWTIGGGFRF